MQDTTEKETTDWYLIDQVENIDTPCLVVYEDRVAENIRRLKKLVGDDSRIRPHVKTNKMTEVCQLLQKNYINKFKCATIAEAEMLASMAADDVLLAYQPVGPKLDRWIQLLQKYPATNFSCMADNLPTALQMNLMAGSKGMKLRLFIDLDTGMHRSGIPVEGAAELYREISRLVNLEPVGFHVYDGHLRITDPDERQAESDKQIRPVESLMEQLEKEGAGSLELVIGGSPSFSSHIHRKGAQLSPGTFVFWDGGYGGQFPDLPFQPAALVLTRVISKLVNSTYTLDLGTKSVASEMPFPRVKFLNGPDMEAVFQSEEHLNVRLNKENDTENPILVGDLFYGVPFHICPTVALYEEAIIVRDRKVVDHWRVIARQRKIHI